MMETIKLEKSIKEIFENGKYIVPLYQRNYAWRKNEIEQLLQDVYESFKKNRNGNYFIGSLVVLKRQNGDYEVIDGQQRLTTLSLITRMLEISKVSCLFYDSRPEVEAFFREYYTGGDIERIDYPQTMHLKNAVMYINEANLDANNISTITINNLPDKNKFIYYFSNNVKLIRVEIPEDTDVASYFEIMNNRGVQLQKHEILKSFLISELKNEKERKVFEQVWEACSQMDVPIQRLFNADLRKKYFGEGYDDFISPFIDGINLESNVIQNDSFSIEDILQMKTITNKAQTDDDEEIEEEASEYKSIIDFPNFIMHVFKLKYQTEQIDIPLNEKDLLSVYDQIKKKIDSKDFLKTLFFCRVVFDRFVTKTISDKNVEDEIKWILHKPTKYEKSWKYTNSFGDSNEQYRIVKALSMLQVTFRTRIYKNWLYDILKWFYEEKKNISVEAKEYINKLDELILQYYKEREIQYNRILQEKESVSKDNTYSLGTDTPHFIFNFIDYLYWVDSKNSCPINKVCKIEDFEFKYWNSVEHHMAREWAERNNIANREKFIDCLGNLCLISKGANSRLSDRDVKEKVQTFGKGNLGANRQVMYTMSKDAEDKYTWTEEKIKQHYNELLKLIEKRGEILNIISFPN